MQHYLVMIVFVLIFGSVSSISVGRVPNARLLPGLRNQSVWLNNQPNANVCLCNALKLYSAGQIAGLNSYSSNSTCQLILTPPVLAPMIIPDTKSNLVLLQPLTDAPCCSDLSWLLMRIQYSQQASANVSGPSILTINSANTLLSTLSNNGPIVRFYRNNLTLQGIYQLPTGYTCATASYQKGFFFVGCTTPYAFLVFNETNLTSPLNIINTDGYIRGIAFVRNDTMMFAGVQVGSSPIIIYHANLITNTYIPLNITYPYPTGAPYPWAVNTVNDSFVLMTSWSSGIPVYALKSSSNISNNWTMVPINATKVSSSEHLGDAIIDSCGRLWVVVYGFGIRIFDSTGTVLLANWTVSTGLDDILLLGTYELFLADYDNNKILHYNPNIQCTS